jgi:molecular chaperone GrpE
VPGTFDEMAMFYPRNGRTIKIPVHKTKRQLPPVEESRRPLLAAPEGNEGAAAGAQPEGEPTDADLKAYASQLQAEALALRKEATNRNARVRELQAESEVLRHQTADLRAELEELQTQASDYEAQVHDWKAEVARLRDREVDVRRQVRHQAESSVREERERLLNRLLAVADNLERALAHADDADPLYAGVRLTLDGLLAQLAKEGVAPLQVLGEPFDPNQHEAVATDGSVGNVVVKVLKTGYTLNGALLRPARVVVGES